ncbi:hypothetical protein BO71DRAFT_122657 [Aspergillus ellipticus CBS 707.79]|uniref:Uncharacterized protein n=1 Tax=Aspergillus ellipticus CBS 707.79 TaxID=1448320 RepID=A0A319ED07_9EURO|nr:hypothetical protein BO71DRAFT_122657 [Aspergillus ellipticus CBS 707.79]
MFILLIPWGLLLGRRRHPVHGTKESDRPLQVAVGAAPGGPGHPNATQRRLDARPGPSPTAVSSFLLLLLSCPLVLFLRSSSSSPFPFPLHGPSPDTSRRADGAYFRPSTPGPTYTRRNQKKRQKKKVPPPRSSLDEGKVIAWIVTPV